MAIRFFRSLLALQDEFYAKHLAEKQVLTPMLEVFCETMPRDNLLSSASLEIFDFIRKERYRDIIKYLVQNHRAQILRFAHLFTFREILNIHDQMQGFTSNNDFFLEAGDEIVGRQPPTNARLMEHIVVDQAEEEYWNTSDPEDEDAQTTKPVDTVASINGSATPSKPLVDYPSDEEGDENADSGGPSDRQLKDGERQETTLSRETGLGNVPPPERLSEKRRREEDDEDELGKLMQNKRRNSHSASPSPSSSPSSGVIRRRKSFTTGSGNATPRKIAISLSPGLKTGRGARSDEDA